MTNSDEVTKTLGAVRGLTEFAAGLARSAAPVLLASAVALLTAYRASLLVPESFAAGSRLSRSEAAGLAERSIRAELATALGLSERAAARRLEHAQLLVDDLPCTRAALAEARILWEAGEVICAAAAILPSVSRAALDERAAAAATTQTPTQLRRTVARLRDELHEEPFIERHARAREDRSVWVGADIDGMATLSALLPAPVAIGAYNRLDRIARSLRDSAVAHVGASGFGPGAGAASTSGASAKDGFRGDGSIGDGSRGDGSAGDGSRGDGSRSDGRTLAQLRADALADLLTDGEVTATGPGGEGEGGASAFVSGVRAEVRVTLAASTAVGLDDAPADLDGFGLVPADVARELVRHGASFTRVLTDPDTGAVTSVGRTHRLPTPRMRLHLQLRDQTCRFPGCTRPASTAEADHTVEWRNGGETALSNLASLCVAHHHVRHGDRWTYVLHPDGTADWTTPTGRRITDHPSALPGRAGLFPPRASPPHASAPLLSVLRSPPPKPSFVDAAAPF
ncbi:HNH endonuclease signature motif containing protein [Rathayibacter tritici]|uniref:HNH endonuclease signature motif containing protein n=1 Tax=Rathayibacter tritici TaxID=33888 RepID=UPI001472948A|nr:HNH endonuclease signature motif containing protein [Rathayibacter tritici]